MLSFIYKIRFWLAINHARKIKLKLKLAEIRHANDPVKKPISSSKLLLWFIMVDFLTIQVFCMWFMVKYPDYADIGSLIGIALAIIGQVGALLGYYKKSTAENTSGGIVHDAALQQNTYTDNAVG